jgi:hypothetical protein
VNLHVLIVGILSGWNNKTGENLVWDLAVQSSFVQQSLLLKNSSTFKLLLCREEDELHYAIGTVFTI